MEATHDTGAVIGVDLGGTKLMAGLFDNKSNLVSRELIKVSGLSSEQIVDSLVSTVLSLAELSAEKVQAAGLGIPSTIDQRSGTVVQAANLPLKDLPLHEILVARTGIAIFLDNDANVAALAEQRQGVGAGQTDDLLMITLGTGFGGGIVSAGRIIRGSLGAGAELGHMTIDYDGPPCTAPNCPGIGCIESFVSGTALARDAQSFVDSHSSSKLAKAVQDGEPARGETVLRLALEGDQDCIEILEQMGRHLGVAMASLVNIFNPGVIAVGGGLSPTLDIVLPVARKIMKQRSLRPGSEFVKVVKASFGPDAGMVGAALMAQDGLRNS